MTLLVIFAKYLRKNTNPSQTVPICKKATLCNSFNDSSIKPDKALTRKLQNNIPYEYKHKIVLNKILAN